MNTFNPNMAEIIEHRKHEREDKKMSSDDKRRRNHVRHRDLKYKLEDERMQNDPFFYL